jgi:hypothetical protein
VVGAIRMGPGVAPTIGIESNNYLTLKNMGINGDIMRRSILLISGLLVFILGCNLFPIASALTFDIGTRISESDLDLRGKKSPRRPKIPHPCRNPICIMG